MGLEGALAICVIGEDPFGSVLDRAVSGQKVGERPIVLRRQDAPGEGADCQIAYIAGSSDQAVADALRALRGTPVLTVTSLPRDAQPKGIVNFVIDDNKVRFQIDNELAASSGLAISSKLLSLAVK